MVSSHLVNITVFDLSWHVIWSGLCHVARSVVWYTQWAQRQLMRAHRPEEMVWQERGAVLSLFKPSRFCCRMHVQGRPLVSYYSCRWCTSTLKLPSNSLTFGLFLYLCCDSSDLGWQADKCNLSVQSEYEHYLASDRPMSGEIFWHDRMRGWSHPLLALSPAVIVWKAVGQHLFLNIIPSNFTARTGQNVWCDRRGDHSVSKSNWLHLDIFRIFCIDLRYILWMPLSRSVVLLKSWTLTGYLPNSTGSSVPSGRFFSFIAEMSAQV